MKQLQYQHNYAALRPQMYDALSRIRQAQKIIAVLSDYLGTSTLTKARALDVGCSTGIIDRYISAHVKHLVGIDIDKDAIAFAKIHTKRKNLKFQIGDGLAVPFPQRSFDLVICHQIYEHVSDSQQLFDEIYRVLRPGGVCFLAAMNKWYPWECHYDLPFLSYVPKAVAHRYVQMTGKARDYFETPKSYWELSRELTEFNSTDYTQKILENPKKYHYNIPIIYSLLLPLWRYLSPTFIFILQK